MPITGEIQGLYRDREQTQPVFPLTKVKAVSDDDGVGLNVLLDEMVYKGDAVGDASVQPRDADTLGGHPAADYATQSFVTNKIAEAQISGGSGGGSVDLSGYATKDEVNSKLSKSGGTMTGWLKFDGTTIGHEWTTADGTKFQVRPYTSGNLFQIVTTPAGGSAIASLNVRNDGTVDVGKAPVDDMDVATKAYSDTNYAPLAASSGQGKTITDCNSLYPSGFYRFDSGSNLPFEYGTLIVSGRYTNNSNQIAMGNAGNNAGVVAIRANNNAWSYINPLMLAGTEYATAEFYKGKRVYAKLVSKTLGVNGNNSSNTDVNIAHGISGLVNVVRVEANLNGVWFLPYQDTTTGGTLSIIGISSTNITLRFYKTKWDSLTLNAVVYYTKESL